MKKRSLRVLWLVATSLLLFALVLSGCQQPAAAPTATKAPEPTKAPAASPAATQAPAAASPAATRAATVPALSKEYKMSMATGGTGGTYYPYGGAIAGIWSKYLPGVTVTVEATGGSVENLRRIANKEAELALVQNDIADYAWNGTEQFKDQKITNFRSVAALYPELLQWVVTPDIKQLSDLKGKAFVVGAAGSGTEVNTRQVFEANGMSFNDLGKKVNLSFTEAANAMKDRQVQGFAVTGGVPTAAISDIATSFDIAIMPIDGQVAKNVMDKNKFFVPAVVKAGSYRGVNSDVNTIAVLAILIAREDLDQALVYHLTKTLVEKQQELAAAHAKGKELDKTKITQGLTVPLHPGAEQYYKEAGIIK